MRQVLSTRVLAALSFFGTAALSNATIIGFNDLGGNNALIPDGLALLRRRRNLSFS